MFMRANRNLHTIGYGELDVAPADQAVAGLTGLSVVATAATHSLLISFTPTPTGADDCFVTFATPGLSAGKTFATSFLRLIDAEHAPAQASPIELGGTWENKFGALAVGQKIVVNCLVIRRTNGAASSPASASTIVV
jgi:hypothetical protein